MKKIIDIISFIGFYLIGGVFFIYQGWQILWGIISRGKDFNEVHEIDYGKGITDTYEPINLDMIVNTTQIDPLPPEQCNPLQTPFQKSLIGS